MTVKTIKIIIIVLSCFLVLTLIALGTVLIVRKYRESLPVKVTVRENYIEKNSSAVTEKESEGRAPRTGAPKSAFAKAAPIGILPAAVGADEDTEKTGAEEDANKTGAGETGGKEKTVEAKLLRLHSRNPDDNLPFDVRNMFPGDSVTRYYQIAVSYKTHVDVFYHADVRPGYEKLAEVLKCRIALPERGGVIYDGLMKDMPAALTISLSSDAETTGYILYEITVYLDTSVGNEYMEKELVADFRWWADGDLTPPKTGRPVEIVCIVAAASFAAAILVLIFLKKKREREEQTV